MLKASQAHAPLVPAGGLYGGTIPSRAPPEPAGPTTGVVVMLSSGSSGSGMAELRIHVADPSALQASATIEVSGRWTAGSSRGCSPSASKKNTSQVVIALPGGQLAGSTVEVRGKPASI